MNLKKIIVLTGTRADYGKLKPLMDRLEGDGRFEMHIFVTGMHMLNKYGYTCDEIIRSGFSRIYTFSNQNSSDQMDQVLAKTISGLSDFVKKINPHLLIIHGDRVETLAGASVGAINNVLTAHIEGGEISGTIDELIRHAVTKLSHVHFVSNQKAYDRLIQLGEDSKTIHVIGSPDIDVMFSHNLPALEEVKSKYEIQFDKYAILLFHPVTTELKSLKKQTEILVNEILNSGRNYVVIYPNNDHGTEIIINCYKKLHENGRLRLFPSMRFEYFLTLLKNAEFIIGNSSAGVREAPYYGVPAINIGSRQNKRVEHESILNISFHQKDISDSIDRIKSRKKYEPMSNFGDGSSALKFHQVLTSNNFWKISTQKTFIDL